MKPGTLYQPSDLISLIKPWSCSACLMQFMPISENNATGSKVDDLFDLNLIYPEIKVSLKSSYLVREPGPRFLLHGTEGSFVKYGADPQEEALNRGQYPNEPDWGKEEEEKWGILNTTTGGIHFRGRIETVAGCYHEFYNLLYDTIVNGKDLAVKPEESLNVIRIIRAAYESCEKTVCYLDKIGHFFPAK